MHTSNKSTTSHHSHTDPVFDKKTLALGIALALGAGSAHADQTALCTPINTPNTTSDTDGNFTMLNAGGGMTGGTNDLVFYWSGTKFNASSDYTGLSSLSNATIASDQPFQSNLWTAHHVQVFAPGTYVFNTALGGGNGESGMQTLVVGADQIGMHMLFDWNGNLNIDVSIVLNKNGTFGSGTGDFGNSSCSLAGTNCLYNSGPASAFAGASTDNRPAGNKVWMLASVDGDGDGRPGIGMAAGGPFGGFNANFNFNGTLSPNNGVCGPNDDPRADPFDFVDVKNATFNTLYTSGTVTVSGLGEDEIPQNLARTAPISISGGGAYSINGGGYATNPGTVSNGDVIRVQVTSGADKGSVITAIVDIGGITGDYKVSTPPKPFIVASNFTLIDNNDPKGITGGANDVMVTDWTFASVNNNTLYGTTFGMKLTSQTPFRGSPWTAHEIRVFEPGSYTFNTACTAAEVRAGAAACTNPGDADHQPLSMTVGTNQLGVHMLFDWNGNTDIDVAIVWDKNAAFGPSPMFTGKGGCKDNVWELSSTDPDGDGYSGIGMTDGPFKGYNANFNLTLGPVPACDNTPPSMQALDTNTSKGTGCSLSPTPVNPLHRGDWWLLMGLVAWMGGLVAKRKRAG